MKMTTRINEKSMLPIGTILHGNHRIDGYLSSGGFGNTYVATHIRFQERVAIKEFFIKGVTERDASGCGVKVSNEGKEQEFNDQRAKFDKEARRLRLLHNEHIVKVHDLFDENGTTYYVMDFIDGESLKETLDTTQQPLGEALVVDVLIQTLDALREAHASGILHLDLKPANIMMDRQGQVKLIDFGASKQFDATAGGAAATSMVTFTSGYAPSEEMERRFDKFGPWTDFYALGATLFNLLTRREPPMPGEILDDTTDDKRLTLPMPGVSHKLRDLVVWLMQTDRQRRPASVDDIIQYLYDVDITHLQPAAEKEANDHRMAPATHLADRHGSKRKSAAPRWLIPVVMACVGLLVGALLFMLTKGNTDATTAQESRPSDSTTVVQPEAEREPLESQQQEKDVDTAREQVRLEPDHDAVAPEPPAPTISEKPSTQPTSVTGKKMTLTLGPCTYTGEVNAKGKPHGKGVAEFKDGRYTGDFTNGDAVSNAGRFVFHNGDVFEGQFNNGFVKGRYTVRDNGSYFVGSFVGNKPATGKWYDKRGNPID